MQLRKLSALALATALTIGGLTACSSDKGSSSDSSSGTTKITIGTTDGAKNAWNVFKDEAKNQGIDLTIQNFGDYNTPNTALSEKQIDVNLFQHIKFLAAYNVQANDNLVPVGATEIVPLGLYYKDHTSVDDIPAGTEVAIPNDSTNQGRAINLLAANNLVVLKNNDLLTPTPADIDTDNSKLKVLPVDAAQTANSWNDGTPAVVNNTFLLRAGIDPTSALIQDDPNSTSAQPYINVFVTRQDNKDNEAIQKLVKIWHSDAVQKANAEDSQNTSVSVDLPAEKLQEILKDTEDKTRAQQS